MNDKLNPLNWDIEPDANTEPLEDAQRKQYEIDHHFHKAFSSSSGRIVLEWLELHTLGSPTWWPGRLPDFGFFREGQNSLMRQIKDKIQRAKDYQDNKEKKK